MDSMGKPGEVFGSAPLLDEGKGNKSQAPDTKPDHTTATTTLQSYLWQNAYKLLRFLIIFGFVGIILAIPVIVIGNKDIVKKEDALDDEQFFAQRSQKTLYYVFVWLLVTWICFAVTYVLASALPYIFRLVARYVNPAHMRYWRIIRTLRRPICIFVTICCSYIAFIITVSLDREELALIYDLPEGEVSWVDFSDDFLEQGTLWAGFYFIWKIVMLYITIHFHSRSDHTKIARSKDMHNALMALYEASIYLYPVGTPEFNEEDMMIDNATMAGHGEHRIRATRYLARLGVDSYSITSFFGNFLSSDPKSHWLRPSSSYAAVERAIANPTSAAALARRIWMSMVSVGKTTLTAQDIAEVLGPFRKEEAQRYFKVLDEAEIGDLKLEEMEWTVAEAGRIRQNIYKSMHNADHCINTFDWVILAVLAAIMLYFIMIFWIPTLKSIQETVKFLGFGLTFAVGRTIHHFLAGCIFILFDHPYDIGDRVELWSGQQKQSVSLIVVRTSLLYTVFKRVDNWMELQAGNEWLQQCRIENVTRSGSNRQAVSFNIDVKTSFKDLQYLKSELEAFLKHPDNKRDYLPNLALAIVGLGEMNMLEMRCIVTHRSNWSNEPLRAARSMKFMCALVAITRQIPLNRPDPGTIGRDFNPAHYVMMTPEEARTNVESVKHRAEADRWDSRDNRDATGEPVLDLRGVSRDGGLSDDELIRKAMEEAERKKAETVKKEAEELAARQVLGKLPLVPRAGPPPRITGGSPPPDIGTSSGFDSAGGRGSGGFRSVPHHRG
ncbi:putative Mechanosensitive ion channel [Triangularia verruculosa]|uniref:Mechanosensitive ion channel n=1 Tax=Triangularia verruculosa TaxID=2587418 RepID=A0AAN7ART7_9PEZI|nr:putative Mechanosensitive ion channel [Triangularia verruculosa]